MIHQWFVKGKTLVGFGPLGRMFKTVYKCHHCGMEAVGHNRPPASSRCHHKFVGKKY